VTVVAVLIGVVVLSAGVAATLAARLLPTLRLQVAVLALLASTLPIAILVGSGWVMFGMHEDAKVLSLAVASGAAALLGALLLTRWIVRPLDRLRATSARLSGGDLTARAPERGPRELRELGVAFNEMATNVEDLFDARRQLVAWASHDLRTPLASLRAMVEAVEDGLASADEYLPAIREQVQTLSARVDDLFELALIDAGVLTLDRRDASLGRLIAGCLRAVDPEARRRRIRLEARVDDDGPTVCVAPDKVERVLLNLLTNALRHTPSDGAVSVQVEPSADHVLVAVEDTGSGLSPRASKRMFERFWRGDESRTGSTGGAGLGLAIAQGLVRAHGGAIWAESAREGGARVVFTLPLGGESAS
jgi:signal transduction histidine kinase